LLDATPGYINQLLTGHRKMGEKVARKYEKKLTLPPLYLDRQPYIDGICETFPEYEPKLLIDSSAHSLCDFELIDASTPLSDDEVGLYFFREVECSAGNGRSQVLENNGLKLRFLKSQLKKHNVPEDMAACVTVSGNSMEPVFPDRSIIGIDTSKTTVIKRRPLCDRP
jgi:hypothetical protein